jgi:adenylate cyclase
VAEERVERRLAAILCADVVGYSRLMGADEEGTLAVLKSHRRELIDPLIDQHRGRIFKNTGDGMLIEFASVVDAVRCAVVMQQGIEDRSANLPESERIRFRIGINLGDVMVDEGDMFGDGVNVAARIEALATPGEICVSASVREEKLPIGFADLGEHGVKNIARPVRVYRVLEKGAEAHTAAADEPTKVPLALLEDRPSPAVMPFTNMSGDPEQEYFVDGIVEDIITGLSWIRWLHVIARNSTFTYKGRAVDVKQVGRELDVRYVLEGSLRKAGSRVRVTAQLIAAASGTHVWAERYDRALDDIFELQDEITLSVVGAIEPSLRQAEIERAKRKRPDSLDAYDLYLRALPHSRTAMPGDADKALALLRQALALQPDYPAAHAAALGRSVSPRGRHPWPCRPWRTGSRICPAGDPLKPARPVDRPLLQRARHSPLPRRQLGRRCLRLRQGDPGKSAVQPPARVAGRRVVLPRPLGRGQGGGEAGAGVGARVHRLRLRSGPYRPRRDLGAYRRCAAPAGPPGIALPASARRAGWRP